MNGNVPVNSEPIKSRGSCERTGHQYMMIDDYEPYMGNIANQKAPKPLREVYGGRYVKHLLCQKCGDYRNVELKSSKALAPMLKMERLKQ